MSDDAQFAGHPDAEQLAAFAEDALPRHERERTMAHLAECAACRQIVFLAGAAEEPELGEPVALPVRRPWWSEWRFALPASLAMAGIALVSAVLLHAGKPAGKQAAEVAAVEQNSALPAPPHAPAEVPTPAAIAPPKPLAAQNVTPAKIAPLPPIADAQTAAEHPAVAQADQPHTMHGALLGAVSAPLFEAKKSVEYAAVQPAPAPVAGAASGYVLAPGTSPLSQDKFSPQQATGGMVRPDLRQANGGLDQQQQARARVTQAAPMAQAAAKPASPASVPQVSAAAAAAPVSLDSNSQAALTFRATSKMSPSPLLAVLPNGDKAAATASNGVVVLALDSAGAVFLSGDRGGHWSAVQTPWAGRAISLSASNAGQNTVSFRAVAMDGSAWTSGDGRNWLRVP